MSWQATLTNLYLRYRFKPAAGTRLVVATARARMSRLMRGQKPIPADVLHQAVPAQGGLCPAEWLRPADLSAQRTLLYFHGGGYFFGELALHRPMCSYLSRIAKADVLSVDYRLAPEHPCPAAVEDALAWYRELLTRIPASQILIGGDSAGGGLALACLQQAREAGLPMPAGIVLFSPWVDLACSGETMQTRARAEVMFTADSLGQAAALYLNGRAMQDPLASPLYADLSGLPPLLIYASRDEILLSDATRLHGRAEAAGITSTLRLQSRMPHVWPVMLMLPEARASLREVAAFMHERVPDQGFGSATNQAVP